ncbi:MAG: hypothetical protein KA314_25190 [Chloroflexi bacterium]|nr:hypothetical protein [Chloroflexota bacterium]MBP8059144.1 hypothetical protein [Chloroflexota bacterium]
MIDRINPFQFNIFGYYSQAVKIDLGTKTMILVAGQLALNEDGTPVAPGNFTAQTHFVFKRIQQVLEASGASLDNVVKALFLWSKSATRSPKAVMWKLKSWPSPVGFSPSLGERERGRGLQPQPTQSMAAHEMSLYDCGSKDTSYLQANDCFNF